MPRITERLCEILGRREAARELIHHIRIGETVNLVDRASLYAFRLQVHERSICVLDIAYGKPLEAQAGRVLFLVGQNLLRLTEERAAA